MAISNCKRCGSSFWRYRRDWPPKGFCSLPCSLAKGEPTPAETPAQILAKWRGHRTAAHGDSHFIQFHNCDTCEWFEEKYSESLGYYMEHPENA